MNAVYELNDGRSLTLYMEGNHLLALVTPMRRGALPSLLKTDCLGKLHSVLFQGSIYYVYENFSHQIVFDSINRGAAQVILSPATDASRFDGVLLREISGQLCLLYQAWNPLTEAYSLCCQNPMTQDTPRIIHKGYAVRLRLQWLEFCGGAYMLATNAAATAPAVEAGNEKRPPEESMAKNRLVSENMPERDEAGNDLWFKLEDGHFFLQTRPRQDNGQQLKAMEAYEALAAEKEKSDEAFRLLQGRCALLEAAGADYESWMAETDQAHREALKALEAEKNQQLQELKEGYEAQLESAKKQYAELAKTAVELQKVGRLWRDKYLGEG